MTRMSSIASPGPLAFVGALLLVLATTHAQAGPQYRIAHEVPLPGDEGWTTSRSNPVVIASSSHTARVYRSLIPTSWRWRARLPIPGRAWDRARS